MIDALIRWSLNNRALVVVGHRNSNPSAEVAPIYEAAGIVSINAGAAAPEVTQGHPWAFRVIERVDVSRGSLDEQEYTLYRDLHCWAISFGFRYRSEEVGQDEAQFWVVFSLKAFPQLHAQLGQ